MERQFSWGWGGGIELTSVLGGATGLVVSPRRGTGEESRVPLGGAPWTSSVSRLPVSHWGETVLCPYVSTADGRRRDRRTGLDKNSGK